MISHIKNKTNKNQKDTIFSSEFIKGTIGEDKIFFDNRDQIAFIGRSNVGKSSVINTLVNKKNLAKSSSLPGKTKEINFFLINEKYYFVDLPGYGYAKVPNKVANKLRKRIIWYFSELKTKPKFVIFITDSNIGITKLDEEMLEILENENHNVIVVANKSDKLSQSQIFKNIEEVKEKLKNYKCVKNIILFSTKTKKGREEVLNILLK